jgi:hypothetical protein
VAAVVTAVAIAAIEVVVVVAGDKTTKGILAGAFLVLPLDNRLPLQVTAGLLECPPTITTAMDSLNKTIHITVKKLCR